MTKGRVYLAGPMTGKPKFNKDAFDQRAALLREVGYEVFNPAERDIERHGGVDILTGNNDGNVEKLVAQHGFDIHEAFRDDTHFICMKATHICMLPGWEYSTGATAEHMLAKVLKLKFIYINEE